MEDDLPLLACISNHTTPSINGQFDPLVTGRIPWPSFRRWIVLRRL
jgi:hypothetical protein